MMDSFEGRLAVVTGGATGMGRELVIQLAAAGCSVATCDINAERMAETARLAGKDAPAGVRITTHVADVFAIAEAQRPRPVPVDVEFWPDDAQVVRPIVSRHQGRIRVDDSPLGGARFIVELPTCTPHVRAGTPASSPGAT